MLEAVSAVDFTTFIFENKAAEGSTIGGRQPPKVGRELTWPKLSCSFRGVMICQNKALIFAQSFSFCKVLVPVPNFLRLASGIRIVNKHDAICVLHDCRPATLIAENRQLKQESLNGGSVSHR